MADEKSSGEDITGSDPGAQKPAPAPRPPEPALPPVSSEASTAESKPAAVAATKPAAPAAKAPAPAAAAPAATAATPVAAKPAAPAANMNRRGFLSSLAIGWITFTTALAATTIGSVRFLFPNVLYEPPQEFKAGVPGDYNMGVDERWKQQYQVWIVRVEDGMYAILAVCTHLGCLPTWLPNEGKFKCPCHGSGFYMSGINFEGPAPRPLERVRIVRADDGQILVDKSKKYQYEKGQWSDPDSFLKLI